MKTILSLNRSCFLLPFSLLDSLYVSRALLYNPIFCAPVNVFLNIFYQCLSFFFSFSLFISCNYSPLNGLEYTFLFWMWRLSFSPRFLCHLVVYCVHVSQLTHGCFCVTINLLNFFQYSFLQIFQTYAVYSYKNAKMKQWSK